MKSFTGLYRFVILAFGLLSLASTTGCNGVLSLLSMNSIPGVLPAEASVPTKADPKKADIYGVLFPDALSIGSKFRILGFSKFDQVRVSIKKHPGPPFKDKNDVLAGAIYLDSVDVKDGEFEYRSTLSKSYGDPPGQLSVVGGSNYVFILQASESVRTLSLYVLEN